MAMASSTIITRVQTYSQPPNLSNPSVPLNVFKFSSSFQTRISHTHHGLKLNHLLNAASEGSASELIEDSKFVPLNPDDPTFGPPALLLLGFQVDELVKIQKFLKELDGEFLEVIFCTEDMLLGSLWEAINTKQPNLEASKIAKSLPRICFLSGLTGEEMMMFIDSFSESGLAGTVFAAVVPNSADKPLQEVIDEIMGDHEMMKSGASR
ncbi:uncharacterized protein LOC112525486 isoform X1 [Cynara cardunculus var. scolymus]|uniref:uncharacterized protein LOC112525486 isoform X1 n=1 Tax=Cynara cardunculus var. scolymus TaxID=59895 RepID=UPI000D62625B|nr:uncharacterized protein LOC112525486 isoform X1 [Cynara cardunculus var. scolymus]